MLEPYKSNSKSTKRYQGFITKQHKAQRTSPLVLTTIKNNARLPLPMSNCTCKLVTSLPMWPLHYTHSLAVGETAPRSRSEIPRVGHSSFALEWTTLRTSMQRAQCNENAHQQSHSLKIVLAHSANRDPHNHESIEALLAIRWLMDGRTQVALHWTKETSILASSALRMGVTRSSCHT